MFKRKLKKFLRLLTGNYDHLFKSKINLNKKWMGNNYGGFYIFPDLINNRSKIYSFGIGEDISFDIDLINDYKCEVFGFDPTPKSALWVSSNNPNKLFNFYQYGIGSASGNLKFYLPKNENHISGSFINHKNVSENESVLVNLKTLNDIITELNHSRIDILKMDIEGAEYEVLDNILESGIDISQILIEFHDRFFNDGREKTINAIAKLQKHGYLIFGVSDSLEEVSFIKRSLINL